MEKLLIIDDFEPVRKSIRRIADREKYHTLQAADGREGLAIFEQEKPEIVITDLKMPYIDGRGVLCAIKEHSPQTEVIVLTGYGDAETAAFLMKNGAFSYLQKPLDLEQLLAVLAKARDKVRRHQPGRLSSPPVLNAFRFEISDRQEITIGWAESERERSLQGLRAFGDECPFPVMILAGDCTILHANRRATALTAMPTGPFNADLIHSLRQSGLVLPDSGELLHLIHDIFKGSGPVLQTQSPELYASMGFVKVRFSDGDKPATEGLILMFPQGNPR